MSEIRTFRSRPQEVEAVQWTGDNLGEIFEFADDRATSSVQLFLLAGKDGAQEWVPVPVGHWVVRSRGDTSDHWPVDPDYFANKYEEITP